MIPTRVRNYLETRQGVLPRHDAEKRARKTSGNIKCIAPNKKCGDRCIPPNWNCRITGSGTDSHSRVVQFDPVKGTAGVIRGTKNVIEGYKKGDPEKIARGVGGIERGVVKLTPGQTVEEKQRFRKRVKAVSTVVFLGTITTLGALKSHQTLKANFPDYRNGLGADIDRAAQRGVNRVMDTWDAGVERVGLGGMFGTGRAAVAAAGNRATRIVGHQAAYENRIRAKLDPNTADLNYLRNRANLRAPAPGIQAVNDIDRLAVANGWDQRRWEAEKISALYSMRTPDNRGRSLSVFAPPAAHEHLAQQWGFQLDSRLARQADFGDEASQVRRRMTAAVTQLQTDLSADMRRRGFPETVTGRRNFINQILDENSAYRGGGMGYADARTARAVTSRRLNSILEARTASDRSRLARTAYDETLDFYDNFFTTASQNLQVRLTQSGNVSSHRNTPFADANIGLHRLHAGQRRGLYQRHGGAMRGRHIPTDSASANFLSRHYFQTEVHPNVNYFTSLTPERAQRIVNGIQGAPNNPTPDQAFLWLERNRYPVRRRGTRR